MTDVKHAQALLEFVDASPSPYHVCETASALLEAAGYEAVSESEPFPAGGRRYLIRGGSLVAWSAPDDLASNASFRLIGAHTDSPNLRVKPNPDVTSAGYAQLGVEVYGGVLLNSWLDRDLGLSGRVSVRTGAGTDTRLLKVDRPLLRLPQLAIHLDRELYDKGLNLNRQKHMSPFWALDGEDNEAGFAAFLAAELDVDAGDVLSWDVMTHPLEPSAVMGLHNEFISAPRLDNQLSCYAGTAALTARADIDADPDCIEVLTLFDHEEVGSASDRGAAGGFLASVLERIVLAHGGDRERYLRMVATSICVSADGAHATNPNYVDRHEPDHQIELNGGPVLKVNANLRYASDADSTPVLMDACDRAGVPSQRFVNRTDLPCGSTIGPLTAAALAIPTVDVGAPQLAMHSTRELTGVRDPGYLAAMLEAFLE